MNWVNVGVYSELPIYNTFQLVMIDRSDIATGDFDFEFNYTDINWETGQASGSDSNGPPMPDTTAERARSSKFLARGSTARLSTRIT